MIAVLFMFLAWFVWTGVIYLMNEGLGAIWQRRHPEKTEEDLYEDRWKRSI